MVAKSWNNTVEHMNLQINFIAHTILKAILLILSIIDTAQSNSIRTQWVIEGSNISLECASAKHLNTPWYQDNQLLSNGSRHKWVGKKGELVVERVDRRRDDGVYRCGDNNQVFLDVHWISREAYVQAVIISTTNNHTYKLHKNIPGYKSDKQLKNSIIKLKCVASGNPPVRVTWFKNDVKIDNIASFKDDKTVENKEKMMYNQQENIKNIDKNPSNTNSQSELWLEVTAESSGVYSCVASNSVSKVASNYNYVLALTNDLGGTSHADNYNDNRAIGWSDNRERYTHQYIYTEEVSPLMRLASVQTFSTSHWVSRGSVLHLNCAFEKDTNRKVSRKIRSVSPFNDSLSYNGAIKYRRFVRGNSENQRLERYNGTKRGLRIKKDVSDVMIFWYFKDSMISSDHIKYRLQKNGTLEVKNINETDVGLYSCVGLVPRQHQMQQPFFHLKYSTYIYLQFMGALTPDLIDVAPVLTSSTQPSNDIALRVAVAAGSLVNLTCHSPLSNPLPSTTWLGPRNEILLDELIDDQPNERRDRSHVMMKSVSIGDQGLYKCLSENVAGKQELVVELIVTVPPKVQRLSSVQTIQEGGEINLECSYEGTGDEFTVVEWRKNGRVIETNGNDRIKAISSSSSSSSSSTATITSLLTIHNTSPLDKGSYGCMVTTAGHPAVHVHLAHIYVAGSLKILPLPSTLEVQAGSSLACLAQGHSPPIVHWQWKKRKSTTNHYTYSDAESDGYLFEESGLGAPLDGYLNDDYSQPLNPSSSSSSSSSSSLPRGVYDEGGVLKFTDVGEDVEGVYTCVATNNQGRTNRSVMVKLMEKSPSIIQASNVSVEKGKSVLMHCGEDGGLVEWRKGNLSLNSDSRVKILKNGSLWMAKSRNDDKGVYTCFWGRDKTPKNTFNLIVEKKSVAFFESTTNKIRKTNRGSKNKSINKNYLNDEKHTNKSNKMMNEAKNPQNTEWTRFAKMTAIILFCIIFYCLITLLVIFFCKKRRKMKQKNLVDHESKTLQETDPSKTTEHNIHASIKNLFGNDSNYDDLFKHSDKSVNKNGIIDKIKHKNNINNTSNNFATCIDSGREFDVDSNDDFASRAAAHQNGVFSRKKNQLCNNPYNENPYNNQFNKNYNNESNQYNNDNQHNNNNSSNYNCFNNNNIYCTLNSQASTVYLNRTYNKNNIKNNLGINKDNSFNSNLINIASIAPENAAQESYIKYHVDKITKNNANEIDKRSIFIGDKKIEILSHLGKGAYGDVMMGRISPNSPSSYSSSHPDLVLVKTLNSHAGNEENLQRDHHHTLHPRSRPPHQPHLSHKYCKHNLASSLIHCDPCLVYDTDTHDNSLNNNTDVDNDIIDDNARFYAWKRSKNSLKNITPISFKDEKTATILDRPHGSNKQAFLEELELLKACVGAKSVVQLIAWSCDLAVMVTEYPYMGTLQEYLESFITSPPSSPHHPHHLNLDVQLHFCRQVAAGMKQITCVISQLEQINKSSRNYDNNLKPFTLKNSITNDSTAYATSTMAFNHLSGRNIMVTDNLTLKVSIPLVCRDENSEVDGEHIELHGEMLMLRWCAPELFCGVKLQESVNKFASKNNEKNFEKLAFKNSEWLERKEDVKTNAGRIHSDLSFMKNNDGDEIGGDFSELNSKLTFRNHERGTSFNVMQGCFPDFASDVWSFGLVVMEIFTFGAVPYPALNNQQVLIKLIELSELISKSSDEQKLLKITNPQAATSHSFSSIPNYLRKESNANKKSRNEGTNCDIHNRNEEIMDARHNIHEDFSTEKDIFQQINDKISQSRQAESNFLLSKYPHHTPPYDTTLPLNPQDLGFICPFGCPADVWSKVSQCLKLLPNKRPTFDDLVAYFNNLIRPNERGV